MVRFLGTVVVSLIVRSSQTIMVNYAYYSIIVFSSCFKVTSEGH